MHLIVVVNMLFFVLKYVHIMSFFRTSVAMLQVKYPQIFFSTQNDFVDKKWCYKTTKNRENEFHGKKQPLSFFFKTWVG